MMQEHDSGMDPICCRPWKDPNDDEAEELEPLPRSKWCESCARFEDGSVDYYNALWKRRTAKARMKRAYNIIDPRYSPEHST